MATVYRKQFTKPLPEGAELFTRKGQQFARWKDGNGRTRTERVTTGRDGSPRIIAEAATFTAKLRNGSGQVVEVPTGCRDETAARSVLAQLARRAELVKAEVITAEESAAADYQNCPLSEHFAAYTAHQRAKGLSAVRIENTRRRLIRIAEGCGFRRLGQLGGSAMEKWLTERTAEKMSAGSRNAYREAIVGFGNWCVQTSRLVVNPFVRVPRADARADCRRKRRAMTEDELQRLLYVARHRPLAEYGREPIKVARDPEAENQKRSSWTFAPLTIADISAAMERARKRFKDRPDFIAELEARGRERALVYKSLVLTGLRKGELGSLVVGQLDTGGPLPCLWLDAADEKNRRGATLPLRADLATDLLGWLAEKLQSLQSQVRRTIGASIPMRLPPDTPLLNVPTGLVRILDRDLITAGITKRDDRGRTVDVHALRHTFGTLLSKAGVLPRTAQAAMRHSSIDLTMNTYTDPRLLDVAGAVAALPELPLDATPKGSPDVAAATGTYGEIPTDDVGLLAPMLAPTSDKSSISGAMADKANPREGAASATPTIAVSVDGDKRNRPPSFADSGRQEIGARRFELPTSASRTQRSNQAELRPVA